MKKIFLFSLIMCVGIVDAGFAGNCTMSNQIGSLRDSIVFGGAGDQGLFCGASGAKTCNYSDFVLIKGKHSVGKGTNAWNAVEDFRVYKCVDVSGSIDDWQTGHEGELQSCDKNKHKGWKEAGRDDNYVYLTSKKIESYGSVGFVAGAKTGMCRIATSMYNPNDFCDTCGGNSDPTPNPTKKTCKDLYKGYSERIRCCEAGKATYWEPKNDLKNGKCHCYDKTTNWDSKTGKCVKQAHVSCEDTYKGNAEAIACCEAGENWINGKCECTDENKVWDSKLKKCVENATPVSPCTQKDCKDTCNVTINESIKCNNGKKFESKKTVKVCKECVEQQNMTCDQYQETINKCEDLKCIENRLKQLTEIDKLLREWCGAGYSTTTPDNGAQINAAKSKISSFFSSAESSASVWKDKDGNFNTARLASDLTAGVVLGTVGGVVSGVVIKKKQVEKGFDALHCTVGGQTVADWGDIFNVGLRR